MGELDYSKLGKSTLEESQLLSFASIELREFINKNKIKKIKDFLECMDNSSYTVSTYYDVLLEARGLADLLKYKYFNTPFITDVYFDKSIEYMKFDKIVTPFCTYGIDVSDHEHNERKDIYSLISRLGFNDKEKYIILDVPISYLEGTKLIDLLNNAYNRLLHKKKTDNDDMILSDKLLLILGYYLKMKADDKESDFMKSVYGAIDYLNDLLAQKYRIERQIEEVQDSIKFAKFSDIGRRK